MSKAYRCDNCGEVKDGTPPQVSDVDIDSTWKVMFAFARRVPQDLAGPEPELDAFESTIARIIGIESSTRAPDFTKAELCQGCIELLLLQFLRDFTNKVRGLA